jgi:hypothetical protein
VLEDVSKVLISLRQHAAAAAKGRCPWRGGSWDICFCKRNAW